MRTQSKPKLLPHRKHHRQVHHLGLSNGGLIHQRHHHGITTNGGRRSGECKCTGMRARGDPTQNQGQGVTPCESSAAAAKGDLCSRSDSPSWLSVRAHLIFCSLQRDTRRGIPQDRDCLTAASTGGVETSKHVASFRDVLFGSRTSSVQKLRVLVVWRVREKARSLSLRQRNRCLGLFFPINCALR